jgi:hypothetical protein
VNTSEDLLARLRTVADIDYGGVSLEETLDRLLREHQEYVRLKAAATNRENNEQPT